MPKCVAGITNHDTDMDMTSNRLRTRLVTTMTVTIPPHHIAVMPVTAPSHPLHPHNLTRDLIEVVENTLLYINQPYLCVIDTLHRFYDMYQNKCITLAANVSVEELRINKGITRCFMCMADVTEIHHGKELTESMKLMTLTLK